MSELAFVQEQLSAAQETIVDLRRQLEEARKGDAKAHVEMTLPPRLNAAVLAWLSANEKAAKDVRWGSYPHGMVLRWVDRAEAAERDRDQARLQRDAVTIDLRAAERRVEVLEAAGRKAVRWYLAAMAGRDTPMGELAAVLAGESPATASEGKESRG